MDGSFSEFFDPSTPSYFPFHDPTVHDVVDLDYFKDRETLQFERFEFISLKTYDQVLDLYDKVDSFSHTLPLFLRFTISLPMLFVCCRVYVSRPIGKKHSSIS